MRIRLPILAAIVLAAAAVPTDGAEVLQTFFAPFPENDMQVSLNMIDAFRGNIGAEMRTAISIVAGSDGTVVYYDHWEDGYEENISSPTQATTSVWGDNNPANGIPPGFSDDVVDAGTIINLESTVDVQRNEVNFEYDGRDKVSVTRPVAMSRAMYAIEPGEVLAEACGVFDVGSHGFEYRAPVGVGTGAGPYTNECFEYSSFHIMGDHDFTRVEIDKDNDGLFEITVYLDQGEPYFVNGGVLAGATVRGTKPFQCYLVTGDIRSNYEMRWYEMLPTDQWDSDYYTAVGGRMDGANYYGAIVYVFNPNTNSITVEYRTFSSTGSFNVAAGSVSDAFQMPTNSGARFFTADNSVFSAVEVFDVRAPGFAGECQDYDWGFTLLPVRALTTMGICAWGPGYGTTASGVNGNPVWVTAVTNTTLYVKYDGDPTTGPFTDPQGNKYDYSTNILPYESVLLFDNSDTNQTGLRYYTLDNVYITSAWGEDPDAASPGNPYLDMGYTIPPFPTVYARKKTSLFVDVNTNGYPDPGDTLRYYIDVLNVGFAAAHNVVFKDDPPTNLTTYATNSSLLNGSAVYDDLPPRLTRFPFDEAGYDIGTINVGATSILEYSTIVLSSLPSNFNGLIHNNATIVGSNANWTTIGFTNALLGGLALTKSGSVTGLVSAGEQFTYTLTIVNTGQFTYTDLIIEDYLPVGVSYVPDSTYINYPFGLTNTVWDRFDVRSYANDNGTIPWRDDWQEEGESDGYAEGDVLVGPDTNVAVVEAYALAVGGTNNSAWRAANLSGHSAAVLSFKYRRHGLDDINDYVDLFVSTNGWATSNYLARFQGAASETAYSFTNFEISAYISTNTAIKFASSRGVNMLSGDQVWFDDVKITLTGSNVTFAGDAPTVLAEGLMLPPGTSIVVTLDVIVDDPPTAIELVNTARTRAEQHPMWLYAWYTNEVDATQGMGLSKTGSPGGLVGPGSNIAYTVTLSNTGEIIQTSVRLEDYLPTGVTYVANSARVWRPFAHTNTVLDLFDTKTYTNSNGTVDWSGDWQEVGESDGAVAGYVQVANDGASVPGHVYALRLNNAGYGASRVADLSGYTSAVFSFDYRRSSWEGTETAAVAISSNGGGSWTTVGTISGTGTDNSYRSTNFNITAYIATNTAVRVLGGAALAADDYFWVDDVRIAYSSANATNRLRAPAVLFTDYFIPPHTSLVVTLQATVNDPLIATQFINTARSQSDQQPEWLYGYATNRAEATSGMTLSKTSSVGAWWDAGETNTYTMMLVNTGELAQTSIVMYDPLPPGVSYVTGSTEIVYWYTSATNYTPTNVITNAFSGTVLDQFTTVAYTNNHGTTNWVDDWVEVGESDGAGSGSAVVTAGELRLRNARGAYRLVNLLGATNAVFSFTYREGGTLEADDRITVSVSSNGGTTWATLLTRADDFGGPHTTNFNITAYASTNTTVRFLTASYAGTAEYAYFDNAQVAFSGRTFTTNYQIGYTWSLTTNSGNPPPTLMSGYMLYGGTNTATSLWVRFKATLDLPATQAAFTNTAFAWSLQTTNLQASVTDRVDLVSIGDFVWYDTNTNGIQDGGETGIVGVTVRLYDGNSNLLASTTTGAGGYYSFSNRPAGSFFLEFVTPTNYAFTLRDQGADDALDSDPDATTGRTAIFSVSGGATDNSRDAGMYVPPSSIGDFVWYDTNTNGIQNAGETGVTNVTVRLYDGSSNLLSSTATDASGYYSFSGLSPGYYFTEFVLPAGYAFTLQDQGGSDFADSDAAQTTGRTIPFYLPSGVNYTNWDAGLTMPQSGLTITKTSDSGGDCYDVGDTITYTITVQNTGTVTHSDITVSDTLPPGITYVTNSTLVVSPGGGSVTNTVRDEFNAIAYTNNDGTANWANDWQEMGEANGPDTNAVRVEDVWGSAYQLRVYNTARGAWRQADLSGANAATLSFDFTVVGFDGAGEACALMVSSNGGATWAQLDSWSADVATITLTNYDITAYISTNTAILFTNNASCGAGEGSQLDNVEIEYSTAGGGYTTNAGSAPPTLTSGRTLAPGQTMTVTFEATVDVPGTVTQVVNIASAVSATHPVIQGGVTDCVTYTDLAVIKDVSDSTPMEVQVIEFSITITNNGPITATGVEIGDVLPDEVQYNSHSNGNYVVGENLWYLGTLPVYGSTTLWINVTVREGTEGMTITNWAHLTYLNELDVVETNNHDDAVFEPWLTWTLIASFRAYDEGGTVVAEWETAGEVGTAGFDLYRWATDEWLKLNDELLPGLLTAPQGGIYRYRDLAAKGGALRYKLVESEFDGDRLEYGPYDVAVEGAAARKSQISPPEADPPPAENLKSQISALKSPPDVYERTAFAASVESSSRRAAAKAKPAAAAGWKGNLVKLMVREKGLHWVSAADLAAPLGLTEKKVRDLVKGKKLDLTNRGRQIAYVAAKDGSGFWFAGEGIDSIYTDENVYWVAYGKARKFKEADGGKPAGKEGGTFRERVHVEQDKGAATALFKDPECDFYLWEYLIAGNATLSNKVFQLDLSQVAPTGQVRMVTHLMGVYQGPHHAVLLVNGQKVGEGQWAGLVPYDLVATFDHALVHSGSNEIVVQAVKDAGVAASYFAVDSFDVEHWRHYAAEGDQVVVRADGHRVITATGFTDPNIQVWHISDMANAAPLKNVRVEPDGPGRWKASFATAKTDAEYVVSSAGGMKAPARLEGTAKDTLLTSRKHAVDYIVICPAALRAGADAWAAWRQGQGWRTLVVDLETIYEVFNYGIQSPWAIRAFLDYAYTYWKEEPRHVLLVGKGTYDYMNAEGYGDNVLPAKLVGTPDGLFASDGWYTDVVGDDGVSEMAIGRLPVLTEAELAALLAKLQAYEAAAGTWTKRTIFVADDPDDGGNFPADSDIAAGLVPGDYVKDKYYRTAYANETAARTAIVAGWNAGGAMLLNYIGHGAYNMIGNGMLRNQDVPLLVNGDAAPAFLGFTCLMGRFEIPGFDCLGELLLMRAGGGASSVWSPSGMSVNALARTLNREFLGSTFADGETLVGEVILNAQEAYADQREVNYMLFIYNLLGDPVSFLK